MCCLTEKDLYVKTLKSPGWLVSAYSGIVVIIFVILFSNDMIDIKHLYIKEREPMTLQYWWSLATIQLISTSITCLCEIPVQRWIASLYDVETNRPRLYPLHLSLVMCFTWDFLHWMNFFLKIQIAVSRLDLALITGLWYATLHVIIIANQ